MAQGQIQICGCRGKGREDRGEEVIRGHFAKAKKATGHPRKDPLRPRTRMYSQEKEIQVAKKHKQQY